MNHESPPVSVLDWISLLLCLHLAGCTTSKDEMLPHGDHTMLDIWNSGGAVGTQQQLQEARDELRRPVLDPERLIRTRAPTPAQPPTRSAPSSHACPTLIW